MFFILCGKQKDYFLWKFIVTVILFRGHVATFFEVSILKEVRILCYLHNKNMMLIPKFQKKTDYASYFS